MLITDSSGFQCVVSPQWLCGAKRTNENELTLYFVVGNSSKKYVLDILDTNIPSVITAINTGINTYLDLVYGTQQ